MNPPSPFFRRYQLEQGSPDLHSRLAGRRRARRLLAGLSLCAAIALAFGAALYLSMPHEPLQWATPWSRSKAPVARATALPGQPGLVGLEVRRGKKTHVFRLQQDGQNWVIEDVTSSAKTRMPPAPVPLPLAAPANPPAP